MDEISDSISWNEYINNNNMKKSDVPNSNLKNVSNFTTTTIDNPPLLSSKYPLLDSLSIEISDLETNPLRVIKSKNIMKEVTRFFEDNQISMNIEIWGYREKKQIMHIPSSDHLRYDRFKQNLKCNDFINSILVALFDNVEGNISSSLINLCHYIAEYYEDEFVLAAGDSGLTFSGSMSTIETASMMNDVDINISQLRILLRILRHKIGTKTFDPDSKMIELCGDMTVPQFGEYKYIHEVGSRPEVVLY